MSEFSRNHRPIFLILGLPPRSERPVSVSRNERLWNGILWRILLKKSKTERL